MSVQRVLGALGAAFALYLAVRSLIWPSGAVRDPVVLWGFAAVYVAVVGLCVFAEARGAAPSSRSADAAVTATGVHARAMPRWPTLLALMLTVVAPGVISTAVAPASRTAAFATSYIGALGLAMTVLIVRRRPWAAWIGLVALGVESMVWLGPAVALSQGLVGSVVWVVAAQLLVLFIDRAAYDTARLAKLQQTASAWRAAQLGRERERRVQVRRALAVAGPVLSLAVARAGRLDDADRAEARIAEASLRDELRGGRLLDDDVRARLQAARRRGVVATVVDEGGLDGLDERGLAQVRAELAGVVADVVSDRLYIRASTDPRVAVTVVGRSGTAPVDEDDVQLWREIPRPHD